MQDSETDWYGPDSATFGDRVAGARDHAGMTQSQLARRLGVKKATLIAWEDDLSEPRANKLSMMAGVLNVSIMWLLTGEGEGAAAPHDGGQLPEDLASLAAELRDLRAEMRATTERAGRLEKKLRRIMEHATQ